MSGEDSFGQWLKQRRKALDLTQAELARRVGCAVVTLQKIEANQRRPSRQIAELLAHHLGIPSADHPEFVKFARMGQASDPTRETGLLAGASFRRPSNLPPRLPVVFGRQQETARLRQRLVEEGVRVLSLVGPPGIGKTTLALQVATEVREEFGDGVFLVPLASVADPAEVMPTVARALGLNEAGSRPILEQLRHSLRDRHMLLVLDNFEHVLAAASDMVDLIAACSWLQVLVTSRAPLRVKGERRFQVPPLVVPDPTSPPDVDAVLRAPAMALFVDRACGVRPDFSLTPTNVGAVVAICRRLEGVPLAIELVAARIELLPPQALLEHLSGSFLLQAGGLRGVPARHQTLHAAFDWSYELLSARERTVFARLAVFKGGCTLTAAESVCGDLPERAAASDILEVLSSLVEKHLVRPETGPDGEPRIAMLETIHEYARKRLDGSGEAEAIRRRHVRCFADVAGAADRELRGPRQATWLRRLDADYSNLIEALQWLLDPPGDAEMGLQLAGALWWYWNIRGYLGEGRRWLSRALRLGEAAPPALRARSLIGVGTLAWQQGDSAAPAFLQESVALYRKTEDRAGLALALTALAMVRVFGGEHLDASLAAEEAVALSQQIGDRWILALALNPLAKAKSIRGDQVAARTLYQESLTLFRQTGDRWAIAVPLQNLGYLAYLQGDYDSSRAWLEESISLHREVGERWMLGISLNILGHVARCRDDYARAAALYSESLMLFRELGREDRAADLLCSLGHMALAFGDAPRAAALFSDSLSAFSVAENAPGIARCLVGLAGMAVAGGQGERAAGLLAAADALCRAAGVTMGPAEHGAYLRHLAATRAQLEEGDFTRAWTAGRALTAREAVALALSPLVGASAG